MPLLSTSCASQEDLATSKQEIFLILNSEQYLEVRMEKMLKFDSLYWICCTGTKATEDSLALYCRINGKELHIGYLPLWVTQNPGRIPFYISPDNLPFARSTSSRDTERETRTPTPERLSRGIVLGEDVFPIEDTMIVEDQLTVTLEEQPARSKSVFTIIFASKVH